MADKEWRPSDWEEILRAILDKFNITYMNSDEGKLVEAGASAMLKALIKYLWGKCDEHSLEPDNDIKVADLWYTDDKHEYHLHRFNCPSCMRQLQESE